MKLRLVTCAFLVAAASNRAEEPRAASVPGGGEKGAVVFVISKWDSNCSGSKRSAWDDMVKGWYNDITNTKNRPKGHGGKAWWKDKWRHNGNIVDSNFTDSGVVAWGDDRADDRGADEPDALMVGLHGGESGGSLRWYGLVRVNEAGTGDCYTRQEEIVLGDYDLDFLHLSSCHSMCKDVWWGQWSGTFDGLHQVNGFHGIMWISKSYKKRYKNFSDDAFDISIADSWVDNHYDNAFWWWEYDHCPVSRGVGLSRADLWDRMENEEYDWVYNDPDDHTWNGVIYMKNCDPKDDPSL